MAESEMGRIERDRLSEPHIAGRRLSVLTVFNLVVDRGDSPMDVAETFDLDVADVHHALAYYDDHPEEMERYRRDRRAASDSVDVGRPPGVEPPSRR